MEIEEALEKIKENNMKRIFVQLPEGLIPKYEEIAKKFENFGLIPVISIETTFGYCDIREDEALKLGCEAIVHFGHNNFGFENIVTKIPVYIVESYIKEYNENVLNEIIKKINNDENVGIVYSLQYKIIAEKILIKLKERKIKAKMLGQILGCNLSSILKDNSTQKIFIISSGKFYGLYPSLKSEKTIYLVDVERGLVLDLKKEAQKIIKIKEWNKKIFAESKKVGLLVSWKKGQIKNWEETYLRLKNSGKDVYILAFDELEEKMLEGIKLDVLINLACPRIGVDDICRFKIPILNLDDIL
ncbi:MAG: diphthamide biosynthesis enzyme Dph2 [Candidatus Aenigmatarchaeota archaeon]